MYIIVLKPGLEPPSSPSPLRQSLRDQVPPPGRVRLSPMAAANPHREPVTDPDAWEVYTAIGST